MMDTENIVYDISSLDNLPDGIDSRTVHRVDNNIYQLYTYKNPKLEDEKRGTIGIFRSVITRDDLVISFSPECAVISNIANLFLLKRSQL